jgi:hypothetical protein
MKKVFGNERFYRTAALIAAALVLAFTACSNPSGGGGGGGSVPGRPSSPVVSIENYNYYNVGTSDYTTNEGGKLTVSWQAVSGATSYEVYYAPRDPDVPLIGDATKVTTSATSTEITGTDIGENTMNYYVWIKAVNANGTSEPSAPTSTLDYFQGQWEPSNSGGDYYYYSNADILYDWGGSFGFQAYIRAVLPASVSTFNGHPGPAGVLIVEYDRDYSDGMGWPHAPDKYFGAQYYYGQSGPGASAGSAMYMGAASDPVNYVSPETATFAEAKTKFGNFSGSIGTYYSTTFEVDYLWTTE